MPELLPPNQLVKLMLAATTDAEIKEAQAAAARYLEEYPMDSEVKGAAEQVAMIASARKLVKRSSPNPFKKADTAFNPDEPRDEKGRWTRIGAVLDAFFPDSVTAKRKLDPTAGRDDALRDFYRGGSTTTAPERTAHPEVSESIYLVHGLGDRRRRVVSEGLRAISNVHSDGVLPNIEVHPGIDYNGTLASYDPSTDPPRLNIMQGTNSNAFSVVHEIGHFLDHYAFGDGDPDTYKIYGMEQFGSILSDDPMMTILMAAIDNSPEIKTVKRAKEENPFGAMLGLTYEGYLDSPPEKFARAYSQWVAKHANDPFLKRQLQDHIDEDRDSRLQAQWSWANFDEIDSAMTRLFRKHGWLK